MGQIIIMGGDGGCGKTLQGQRFPEPVIHADFEYPRAENTRKKQNPDKLVTVLPCRAYYKASDPSKGIKKGQIDVMGTYDLMMDTITKILDSSGDYLTIVLDSISDIRTDIVAAKWLQEYRAKSPKNKDRKSIGKDPSAWSAINREVCDEILFPIINTARMEGQNVIFTAKKEDQYKVITMENGKEDTTKTGKRVLDTQNWMTFECDVIIDLENTAAGKYFMTVTKSPIGVIPKLDITGKNVYDILMENGIL